MSAWLSYPFAVFAGFIAGVVLSWVARRRPWRFDVTIRHRNEDEP